MTDVRVGDWVTCCGERWRVVAVNQRYVWLMSPVWGRLGYQRVARESVTREEVRNASEAR